MFPFRFNEPQLRPMRNGTENLYRTTFDNDAAATQPQGKMIRGSFRFWEIRGMFNSHANSRRLRLYR